MGRAHSPGPAAHWDLKEADLIEGFPGCQGWVRESASAVWLVWKVGGLSFAIRRLTVCISELSHVPSGVYFLVGLLLL